MPGGGSMAVIVDPSLLVRLESDDEDPGDPPEGAAAIPLRPTTQPGPLAPQAPRRRGALPTPGPSAASRSQHMQLVNSLSQASRSSAAVASSAPAAVAGVRKRPATSAGAADTAVPSTTQPTAVPGKRPRVAVAPTVPDKAAGKSGAVSRPTSAAAAVVKMADEPNTAAVTATTKTAKAAAQAAAVKVAVSKAALAKAAAAKATAAASAAAAAVAAAPKAAAAMDTAKATVAANRTVVAAKGAAKAVAKPAAPGEHVVTTRPIAVGPGCGGSSVATTATGSPAPAPAAATSSAPAAAAATGPYANGPAATLAMCAADASTRGLVLFDDGSEDGVPPLLPQQATRCAMLRTPPPPSCPRGTVVGPHPGPSHA